MNGITKETFKDANTDTKLSFLFDYIHDIYDQQTELGKQISELHDKQTAHPKDCQDRFKKLENGRVKDTATASLMGFVGGFIAVIGKKFFGGV